MALSGGGSRRLRHAPSARLALLMMALSVVGNAVGDGAAGAGEAAPADYSYLPSPPSVPSSSSDGSSDGSYGTTGDGSSAGVVVPSDPTRDADAAVEEALSSSLRGSESSLARKIENALSAAAATTGTSLYDKIGDVARRFRGGGGGAAAAGGDDGNVVDGSRDVVDGSRDVASAAAAEEEVRVSKLLLQDLRDELHNIEGAVEGAVADGSSDLAQSLELHLPMIRLLSAKLEYIEPAFESVHRHLTSAAALENEEQKKADVAAAAEGESQSAARGIVEAHRASFPSEASDEDGGGWTKGGGNNNKEKKSDDESSFFESASGNSHGTDYDRFMKHFRQMGRRRAFKKGGGGRRRLSTAASTTCAPQCDPDPLTLWSCQCDRLVNCAKSMSLNDLAIFFLSGFISEDGTVDAKSDGSPFLDGTRGSLGHKMTNILALIEMIQNGKTIEKCNDLLDEFHTECELGEECDGSKFTPATVDDVCDMVGNSHPLKIDEISMYYDEHRNLPADFDFNAYSADMWCHEQPSVRVVQDFVRCAYRLHQQRGKPIFADRMNDTNKDPWMFGQPGWNNLAFPTAYKMVDVDSSSGVTHGTSVVLAPDSELRTERYEFSYAPGSNGLCWADSTCTEYMYDDSMDATSPEWFAHVQAEAAWGPPFEAIHPFESTEIAKNTKPGQVFCKKKDSNDKVCFYRTYDGTVNACDDDNDARMQNLVDEGCVVDVENDNNGLGGGVACSGKECYLGLSGCVIDPGDSRAQVSLDLLFGSGASVGQVCSAAHAVEDGYDMPGTCCLDGPFTDVRWGKTYQCGMPCERYGPFLSWFSEGACDNVGGTWCRNDCTKLQECVEAVRTDALSQDDTSFVEYIEGLKIDDAGDQEQCEEAREFVGFEPDHLDDSEVCEALVALKCDPLFARENANGEHTATTFPYPDMKELKQPDDTAYPESKEIKWSSANAAIGETVRVLSELFDLYSFFECLDEPLRAAANGCAVVQNVLVGIAWMAMRAAETGHAVSELQFTRFTSVSYPEETEIYDQSAVLFRNMQAVNANIEIASVAATDQHNLMINTIYDLLEEQVRINADFEDYVAGTTARKLLSDASIRSQLGALDGEGSGGFDAMLEGLDEDRDSVLDDCEEEDRALPSISFADSADVAVHADGDGSSIVVSRPKFTSKKDAELFLVHNLVVSTDDSAAATDYLSTSVEYVDGECSETRFRAVSVDGRCPGRKAASAIFTLKVDDRKPIASCGFDVSGHEGERGVLSRFPSDSGMTLYLPPSGEKYVDVGFRYEVEDDCSGPVAVNVTVSSNEYESSDIAKMVGTVGGGGGDGGDDEDGSSYGFALYVVPRSCEDLSSTTTDSFCVEEEGFDGSRLYEISVRATDNVGNVDHATCAVYLAPTPGSSGGASLDDDDDVNGDKEGMTTMTTTRELLSESAQRFELVSVSSGGV